MTKGSYVDCFARSCDGTVPLPVFIAAFFDSWVFRLERRMLATIGKGRSTTADVAALAEAKVDRFATWRVLARDGAQLLLEVPKTPIRTWLAVEPVPEVGATRLLFGSALVPEDSASGLGWGIRASIGPHRLYSRLLLNAAATKLMRMPAEELTKVEG